LLFGGGRGNRNVANDRCRYPRIVVLIEAARRRVSGDGNRRLLQWKGGRGGGGGGKGGWMAMHMVQYGHNYQVTIV